MAQSKTRGTKKGPARGRTKGRFTQHRHLERLRRLLEAHPVGLPLRALGVELRVSTRSIRRYLSELDRDQTIESLTSVPGGPRLWRIKPSERGRTLVVRRTQAYGLLSARDVFEPVRGSALYEELEIVFGQLVQMALRPTRANQTGELSADARLEERFRYHPAPPHKYASRSDDIDDLFRAVAEYRSIRFQWRPPGPLLEAVRTVTFHPYGMVLHRGALFLAGYDVERGRPSAVRLDDIADLQITGGDFSLPAEFDLGSYCHGEFGVLAPRDRKIRVLIEFDHASAEEISRIRVHPSQRVATSPDGRVRISLSVPESEPVVRWVLGFGPRAKIVEPPELVAEVVRRVDRTLARYREQS